MGLRQGWVVPIRETFAHHSIIPDGAEPDRNGPRRLEVVKTNLCRYPEALGVWFQDSHELHELGEGGEGKTSHELHELGEGGEGKTSHELHELSELGKGEKGGGTVPRVVYGEAPKAYREPTQGEGCGGSGWPSKDRGCGSW